MSRLFLRLYLAVITAMFAVGFGVFFFIGGVIGGQHTAIELQRQLKPSMTALAKEISETPVERRGDLLRRHAATIGPSLAILPIGMFTKNDCVFSHTFQRRGIAVVGDYYQGFAYAPIPGEDKVLELELHLRENVQAQWLGPALERALRTGDEEGVTLEWMGPGEADLKEAELARMRFHPTVVSGSLFKPTYVYAWSPERQQIVRVESSAAHIPPGLKLFGIVFNIVLVGLVIFWFIRPIQRRLARLSEVAEALGGGDLSARAGLEGAGAVQKLGTSFDRMADRVQHLVESQEALLRAVSHELRTPISRLFFSVDLVSHEPDEDERARMAEGMYDTLHELRDLTSELLEFTRLGEGAPGIERSPCLMRDVVERSVQNIARPDIQCEIKSPDWPLEFEGNARLLARALGNLVSNAQKHARSRIEVSSGGDADSIWVRVDDDGAGIPEADRVRVLEAFVRLDDSRCRSTGGVGLGLAIVRRVVKHHEGTLSIEDSPMGGARVSIRLPRILSHYDDAEDTTEAHKEDSP